MAHKYSPILLDHFMNPRNIGAMEDYTLQVTGENPRDGDYVRFFLKVEEDTVKDVSFQVKGCPRFIAASSFTSEKIKNHTISEILSMDPVEIQETLEIEEEVFACVSLPLKTIQKALLGTR
ncbi:MAG TPA: iron-sulfur cluster assembly scaffold protein [Thermotogota bacterium]|nr:iron-sulfur cluster assembly scaffold protein [Thermotogota bacterium]HRW93098.1 iron-sulfur cluster assembly scaffold protein [Thermotogota bacterium]